jgi:hypothetical protein
MHGGKGQPAGRVRQKKGAIFGLTKSLAVEFARERGDVRFSWADRLAEAVLRDDR